MAQQPEAIMSSSVGKPVSGEEQARTEALAETALPAALDLLSPWDLPNTLTVSAEHRKIIDATLQQLEDLLNAEDTHADDVAALLQAIPATGAEEHKLEQTGSAVTLEQIAEYDQYFLMSHVHSPFPALVMLRGLIETCQVFFALCSHDAEQQQQFIDIQRQGFIEYIAMLRRMLDDGEQA